jgi:hypothetical protein
MLFACRIIEEAPAVQVSTMAWPDYDRYQPNDELKGGRSKVMHSRCGFFVTCLVSVTAASLRFPSEFATVMVIDAKRNANFRAA